MTLSVIDKLNMKRHAAMPIYQYLAEQIIAGINSGELTSGDKLPTEHELAKKLGINRLTVSKSYKILEKRNLVRRCRGLGTFVFEAQDELGDMKSSKTIYVLIPHPILITLQFESSIYFRRILYGLSTGNDNNLVQLVPVSSKFENPLKHIDWDMLRQIPEGARVFIYSMWFRYIFPFLQERNIQAVFLDDQYGSIEYAEEYEQLVAANWNCIVLDRFSAIKHSIEYLYNSGRHKIAVIKKYKDQSQHPFIQGMVAAYKKCGIEYDASMLLELEPQKSTIKLENEFIEFWKRTKFDALVFCTADYIKPVYSALTKKLNLRLPDDVALMSFSDIPAYLDFDIPITAIDFSGVDIGREVVRVFGHKKLAKNKLIFNAKIIERESSKRGAGSGADHVFMPEISLTNESIVV